MPPSQVILDLVEHFDRDISDLRSSAYNETQLRREFLDPFFEALGWDVNNRLHYSETYKDVVHEPAREMEHGTPDYCFRVGGTSKFYVEAKKPAVRLKDNPEPALQLRRYAWSSKLPLSILSSFDELAIYDCRTAPRQGDKASTARIAYYTFQEYPEKWDEIASRFSKDAVLQGSFDRFVESSKAKKGTAEVDSAFLQDIQSWRYELAASIAARNPDLGQREVNFAVQRTIDRIIFLRICEDRGLERYGQLRDLSQQADVYQHLCDLFRKGDERYNSGLFHFHKDKERAEDPDTLTPMIKIDDWRLKPILKRLYYPDSPYAFSHVPADILGQVYEQFLGQVIRITPRRHVEIEPKPEVKKAGGVYYTPTYIVDYIVKNTVGRLVDCKTPKQLAKVRVLDPACGSGSFLIGAYQFLLNWYRDEYVKDGPQKHKNEIVRDEVGNWRLTLDEKKKVLIRHIYGVDIDMQAVEVTKLSLLLKVLEGESQFKLFHERALPDLGKNIKCGNSLVACDYSAEEQLLLSGDEERFRINVFDWDGSDGFPAIVKAGGFDAVIGNPPYGASVTPDELDYLMRHYPEGRKFPDSYCFFMVRALRLTRAEGFASFVVPNTFCDLENCDDFRNYLLTEFSLTDLWQSRWAFKAAIVDTVVFVFRNESPDSAARVRVRVDGKEYERTLESFRSQKLHKIDYRNRESDRKLLSKVDCNPPLSNFAKVRAGVKMYEKGKGTPPQTELTLVRRPFSVEGNCPQGWKPIYRGEDVQRYSLTRGREYVKYGPWLAAPRDPELFLSPKILMRRTDDHLRSSLEDESAICVNSCHVIKFHENMQPFAYEYLLGVLNSSLLQRVFELQNPQMVGKVFAEIKVIYVERLPIAVPRGGFQLALRDRITGQVQTMLKLVKKHEVARMDHERTALERQIEGTDRQIDKLVNDLYGLTQEEIAIVESTVESVAPVRALLTVDSQPEGRN
jgi:type I restriction-modification system DNA methylase subunit